MSKQDKIISGIILGAALFATVLFLNPQIASVPQPSVSRPESNPAATTLFFAGDIMLSRNVADRIYKANDFGLPFQKIKEQIQKTDRAFANLESPFLDEGRHFVPNSLVFNADPKSIEGLKLAGFDILS